MGRVNTGTKMVRDFTNKNYKGCFNEKGDDFNSRRPAWELGAI